MIIDFSNNPEIFIKKYHSIFKDTMNYDDRAKDIILKKALSLYGYPQKKFFGFGKTWSNRQYIAEYCDNVLGEFTFAIDSYHVKNFRRLFLDYCEAFDIKILENGDLEYNARELKDKKIGFSIDSKELNNIEKSQYFIDNYLKEEIK